MGIDSRHAGTGSAGALVSLGCGTADASTRRGQGVRQSSKCWTAVLLLTAVVLAIGLSATPASSATTASKALRFVVLKRTKTHAVVERGSVRLVVRFRSRFVSVHGVPRYRVIKRAGIYCLLMPVVNVVAYGAKHDGSTDDTAAIAKAMRAAVSAAKGVYVPAGTYHMSSITVPVGLAVYGAGMRQAWLKGQVAFGSASTFTDLKIGPDAIGSRFGNASIYNAAGSKGTSFTRCHFRGGGDTTQYHGSNILLGSTGSLSNLTFTDCEIERSLGTGDCNTISTTAWNSTVDTVTWHRCHFGVSNGTATGSKRMMVECWTNHGASNWWRNLTFRGCEFEATESWCLDFACGTDSGRGTGVLVEGCTFHGAGYGSGGIGAAIDLEWPADVTIRNNHFHRCRDAAVFSAGDFMGTNTDTHWRITGNTFDWDTAEQSIPVTRGIVYLCSANNVVTGNTFYCHTMLPPGGASPGWDGCVEMGSADAHGNIVTGNRLYLADGVGVFCEHHGASGNTTMPNRVVNP